jgi:hypothetical protein
MNVPVKFQKARGKEAHTRTDTPVQSTTAGGVARKKGPAPKKKAAHQESGELLLPPASCSSTLPLHKLDSSLGHGCTRGGDARRRGYGVAAAGRGEVPGVLVPWGG